MIFRNLSYFLFAFFVGINPIVLFASPSAHVSTQSLQSLIIFPISEAPATAISLNDAVISAEISGIILEFPYKVGDLVNKGDTLAKIGCKEYYFNSSQFESQIKATEAKIKFNTWQLKRAKSLANSNNVSQERLQELQSNLASLKATLSSQKAQLNQANLQISRCAITAPFNAIVVERKADIGEMATPGREIIRVVDIESMEVSAQLQPKEVINLKQAKSPRFITKDGEFDVSIRAAVNFYNERSRTQEVRCEFINDKPLPGSVGRLVWQDKQPHLPAYLLNQANNQYGVFFAHQQKAHFVPIPEAIEGRPIPIPQNLKDDVIVGGRYKISDQQPLVIQTPEQL